MSEKQFVMNMTWTKSLYAVSRSVQSIWIFWHGLLISRVGDCHEICHFILAWLQMLHWVVDGPWSTIPKEFFPSLWRLMGPGWPMWACQSFPSPLDAGRGSLEVGFCLWIFSFLYARTKWCYWMLRKCEHEKVSSYVNFIKFASWSVNENY